MLARWVYFGNVFDDALPEDSAEIQQLVTDLTEAVRRDAPYSFAVASDLLLMVQNTTDVHFSSIGILMISAFVEVLHRPRQQAAGAGVHHLPRLCYGQQHCRRVQQDAA